MVRGVVALFRPSVDVQRLIDADHALELSGNRQLREAPPEQQEQHRRKYAATIALRLRLLRRNVFWSFAILASAVMLALLSSWLAVSPSPSGRALLGGASVFCFAWATLGRLGWSGQSYKGDTVVERLDVRIFKLLYWLGTFLGTLALI
jgi:hypothetical protein